VTSNTNIQEQLMGEVEEFFLKKSEKDLYAFLQEVLKKPLLEKILGKRSGNWLEAEKILKSASLDV
ncbi:MAG: hypothetical protein SVW57_02960, partial [Thermodesulfobacteriota bacterium]|nr:hypothetical protein [Thermodesulfobacteriota bacterium]